uniref:Methyltransferase type 11 domain-containing protein n=1 Tax=Oncorhynchus mykiss TaxID=8022 RepID=A0A8C7R763_ONCMY
VTKQVHDNVKVSLPLLKISYVSRFFGCALPVPEKLQDCRILDLGSGSGRDCYALGILVGETGHVTCHTPRPTLNHLTSSSLASRKYIHYHQEKFGFLLRMTMDIIVSNCVICLCPDKKTVVREAYKVLKVSKCAMQIVQMLFTLLCFEVGFSTPHLISASHIEVHNCELKRNYASGTYRLFKLPKKLEMSSFDSSHCFKHGHLSPFLLGCSVNQCSKTGKAPVACGET